MTDRRSTKRWPWLVVGALGLASFAVAVTGAVAQEGGTVVTGLGAVAASDGMGQTAGDPNADPYPVAKGDIAHTEATMATGPTGYALASTAWPGPLAANAGSLAVLLGAPDEAGNANYGGRAEAFSGGPNDAEAPGMIAHAKDGEAEAIAGAQDFESAQGQTTGDVRTRSYTSFLDREVRSTSTCTASDLGFAGGAVSIGSVRTEAHAVTNGAASDAGGRTVVSGTKIGGQDAEVDENGVRFTDPATAPIGEQVLSNFGIDMYVAQPRHEVGPSSARHQAGSLVVIWDPPETDYGWIYEVCGSNAIVEIRLGEGFTSTTDALGGGPATTLPFSEITLPVDPIIEGEPFSPGTSDPPSAATSDPDPSFISDPISFVRDSTVLPYLFGIICIVVSTIGLGRAREAALVPRADPVACPLEGAPS